MINAYLDYKNYNKSTSRNNQLDINLLLSRLIASKKHFNYSQKILDNPYFCNIEISSIQKPSVSKYLNSFLANEEFCQISIDDSFLKLCLIAYTFHTKNVYARGNFLEIHAYSFNILKDQIASVSNAFKIISIEQHLVFGINEKIDLLPFIVKFFHQIQILRKFNFITTFQKIDIRLFWEKILYSFTIMSLTIKELTFILLTQRKSIHKILKHRYKLKVDVIFHGKPYALKSARTVCEEVVKPTFIPPIVGSNPTSANN